MAIAVVNAMDVVRDLVDLFMDLAEDDSIESDRTLLDIVRDREAPAHAIHAAAQIYQDKDHYTQAIELYAAARMPHYEDVVRRLYESKLPRIVDDCR